MDIYDCRRVCIYVVGCCARPSPLRYSSGIIVPYGRPGGLTNNTDCSGYPRASVLEFQSYRRGEIYFICEKRKDHLLRLPRSVGRRNSTRVDEEGRKGWNLVAIEMKEWYLVLIVVLIVALIVGRGGKKEAAMWQHNSSTTAVYYMRPRIWVTTIKTTNGSIVYRSESKRRAKMMMRWNPLPPFIENLYIVQYEI